MKTGRMLFSIVQADFRDRTRRTSFLVTLCLVIYMGYAVNTGQILVRLADYRGVYNSAWVGTLMALVITFFLGLAGFYLIKNAVARDERTGVGQIIASTPLSRPEYLLGKWLSNFALLTSLVMILAMAAILMQVIQQEVAQIDIWALIAPLLLIALPMMALVAAFAVFFESISLAERRLWQPGLLFCLYGIVHCRNFPGGHSLVGRHRSQPGKYPYESGRLGDLP